MPIHFIARWDHVLRLVSAGLVAVLVLAVPAASFAQEAETPGPDSVVATIGEETITEADLAFAAEDLAEDLASVPPEERRAFLTTVMIDMKLLANAAREANLQESDVFKRRLNYLEDRALRRAYFAEYIGAQATEEAIQAAYDEFVAGFEPQEEIRARHILVASEEDAKTIRAEIEAGKPFEVAALENSMDGSAQNGGDLGYFTRGRMVAAFEEAAFALDVGEISQPVQSQFGWHLIKLEDRRQSAPPPLEQMAGQLQQKILIDAFNTTIETLQQDVEITYADPAMAEAVQQQLDASAQ